MLCFHSDISTLEIKVHYDIKKAVPESDTYQDCLIIAALAAEISLWKHSDECYILNHRTGKWCMQCGHHSIYGPVIGEDNPWYILGEQDDDCVLDWASSPYYK